MKNQSQFELDVSREETREALEEKRISRLALRGLVQRLAGYRGSLAIGTILMITATVATLVEPWLIGRAIDEGMIAGNSTRLMQLALWTLLTELIRVSSIIGHLYCFEWLGQSLMHRLRTDLFSRMIAFRVPVLDRQPVGRLITRATNDIASMSEMFSSGLLTILSNSLLVLGTFVSFVVLDFGLGMLAVSLLPLLVAVTAYFSVRLKKSYRRTRGRLSVLNGFLAETILGMKVIQLFNRQDEQFRRFSVLNESHTEAHIGTVKTFALFQPTITFFSGVSVAMVLAVGGGMAADGAIKVGVLSVFFTYVLSIFQPIREIADKWNVFLSGMASAERVFSVFEWETEERALAHPRRLPLRGEIQFENVWFSYRPLTETEASAADVRWALRDVSFTVPAGSQIGLVGATGSGKSSLLALLLRYYEPTRGRILLDGRDLREYDPGELRASLGLVQQDVFLFSGTLADNLTLWRDEPLTEIELSALQSVLKPFGLNRLDLEIGERGGNLSLGQRQIISFVRAWLTQPRLWILDEATSSVDSNSERQLVQLLKTHAAKRTRIVVAHRLATVRDSDQILVLHQGRLRESGRHSELLASNGLYAHLYRAQREESPAKLGSHSV